MADISIRDQFFADLAKGAKWDVGVSIARGNPLPLDANSVFKTYEDLVTYTQGVLSYPGQFVTVVGEASSSAYILDANKSPILLASTSGSGDVSVELGKLANMIGDTETLSTTDKSSLVKAINELKAAIDLTASAKDLSDLEERVGTAESDIDKLETAVNTLNGDATVVGSVDKKVADAVAGIVAGADSKYDTLKEISDWLTNDTTGAANMANDISDLKSAVGVEAAEGVEATGIYAKLDNKVEKVEGYSLVSDTEIERLAGVATGAEVNYVKSTSEEFTVTEGKLEVKEIAATKITGLNDAVDGKTDKVANAVEGNFAGLDADGNLVDSGKKAADFATADQGRKADSAVQSITTGDTDGTIKVDGAAIAVHGLGSAAYTEATAYATANHNHDAAYAAKSLENTVSTHTADTDIHITADERTKWNTASATAADNASAITTLNGDTNVAGSVAKKIDTAITNLDLANTYAAKTHNHVIGDITDLQSTLDNKANASDLTTHTGNADIHVTAADKTNWNGAVSKAADNASAIAALQGTADDTKDSVSIVGAKAYADATVSAAVNTLDSSLATVAKTGNAADVSVASTNFTNKTVEGALTELFTAIGTGGTASAVTISESNSDLAKIYTIAQGGSTVGTINVPKDMVVESGSVVTLTATDDAGHAAGTYIKLVLANANGDEVWVPVDTLIEYVTSGSVANDMIVVAVSADHKVTATITDGTITKAKLDNTVQASLDLANSAVQPATLTASETTLKAYADQAETDAIATAAEDATTKANAAEANAKGVDERVVINKVNGSVEPTEGNPASAITSVTLKANKGNIMVGLAKVIINSAVYFYDVTAAASEVTINIADVVDFDVDTSDDVYVEFREIG